MSLVSSDAQLESEFWGDLALKRFDIEFLTLGILAVPLQVFNHLLKNLAARQYRRTGSADDMCRSLPQRSLLEAHAPPSSILSIDLIAPLSMAQRLSSTKR